MNEEISLHTTWSRKLSRCQFSLIIQSGLRCNPVEMLAWWFCNVLSKQRGKGLVLMEGVWMSIPSFRGMSKKCSSRRNVFKMVKTVEIIYEMLSTIIYILWITAIFFMFCENYIVPFFLTTKKKISHVCSEWCSKPSTRKTICNIETQIVCLPS